MGIVIFIAVIAVITMFLSPDWVLKLLGAGITLVVALALGIPAGFFLWLYFGPQTLNMFLLFAGLSVSLIAAIFTWLTS